MPDAADLSRGDFHSYSLYERSNIPIDRRLADWGHGWKNEAAHASVLPSVGKALPATLLGMDVSRLNAGPDARDGRSHSTVDHLN
jgi:hypothetical protein